MAGPDRAVPRGEAGQLGGGRTKLRGTVDVISLQTLTRRDDIGALTAGYGLVIADECHHVPAAAFEDAAKQVPARRWLGLTATPYRRDKLDDLIHTYLGPVRHVITIPRETANGMTALPGSNPRAGGPLPSCTFTGPATSTPATPAREPRAG